MSGSRLSGLSSATAAQRSDRRGKLAGELRDLLVEILARSPRLPAIGVDAEITDLYAAMV
jgi:hypothetical protein